METIWFYVPSLGILLLFAIFYPFRRFITCRLCEKLTNCCKGSSNMVESPKESSPHFTSFEVEDLDEERNKGGHTPKEERNKGGHTPKGIQNLKNTCFMNAILQVLAWCPNLEAELAQVELKKCCKMTMSVLQLLRYTHSRVPVKFMPNDVLEAARKSNNIFEGNNQQDSFEMFNTIIGTMKAELQKLHKKNNSAGSNYETTEEENLLKLPGVRLFYGTFVTVLRRNSCKHVECTYQDFPSLTVPIILNRGDITEDNEDIIQENANGTLLESKENSYSKETVIERGIHDLVKTEECEEKILPCRKCDFPGLNGICYRKMQIFKPPSILVLHIDRFRKINNRKMEKKNDLVTYPETLNFEPYCSIETQETNANKQLSFNLFGVVVHLGSIDGGHYVTYIKTTQQSSSDWYEIMRKQSSFEDHEKYRNKVKHILEEQILSPKNPYLEENRNENKNRDTTNTESFSVPEMTKQTDGEWYYINDAMVTTCKREEAIDNKNAYILMYAKNY